MRGLRGHFLVAVVACALYGGLASSSDVPLNKLIVRYSPIPDPLHLFSFFELPRTEADAGKADFSMAQDLRSNRGYSVWCRRKDYRVCVLFDLSGSVAGIQVSHTVQSMNNTKVPQQWDLIPSWNRQTLLDKDVYSAIAYFVDPATLPYGGRTLENDTNTAEGIWLEEQGNVQKVPFTEAELEETTKFTRQGCLRGMGRHYFYDMTPQSKCEDRRPYYLLYGERSKELLGFGVITFGIIPQPSPLKGRRWFLNPPAVVSPIVAPNGPSCTMKWMWKYGATSLHVYFQDKPWTITC